jgi:CheY-like chemotaxis protein
MTAKLDPELLAACVPEFEAGAVGVAAAPDAGSAAAALDLLRVLAEGLEAASLAALVRDAAAGLDRFDPADLARRAEAMVAHLHAIAAAGEDLPLPAPAALPATPPATPPAAPPEAAAKRALIVDDSAIMRRLLREILATDPAFAVVGEAADGAQGLDAMRRLQPDLVLLDIEMPVLDGLATLRRWALEGAGAVVIVSSAARPAQATAIEARRLGAAGIVGKPSGALSLDIAEKGAALLRAARRAVGLPAGPPAGPPRGLPAGLPAGGPA